MNHEHDPIVESPGQTDGRTSMSAESMGSLLEKVDRIDRVVSRLDRMTREIPPLVATAVDAVDERCRRLDDSGIHLDERIARVTRLLDRLTDDSTYRLIEMLLDRGDRLASVLKVLDDAPGLVAMFVDMVDEYAAKLVSQGIDVEKSLRQGLHAAIWLGSRVSETELERLGIFLRSDVLEPHALAVVGKSGKALAVCHEGACQSETPERLGPIGLLKSLNDPDVQRSLAFLIQVARCFGRSVNEPVADEA